MQKICLQKSTTMVSHIENNGEWGEDKVCTQGEKNKPEHLLHPLLESQIEDFMEGDLEEFDPMDHKEFNVQGMPTTSTIECPRNYVSIKCI